MCCALGHPIEFWGALGHSGQFSFLLSGWALGRGREGLEGDCPDVCEMLPC